MAQGASLPVGAFALQLPLPPDTSDQPSSADDQPAERNAVMPAFDFTSLDEEVRTAACGLAFTSAVLEADYVRYNVAGDGSFYPGCILAVMSALTIAFVYGLRTPGVLPWVLPATTAGFATVSLIAALLAVASRAGASAAFLEAHFAVLALCTHATVAVYTVGDFSVDCATEMMEQGASPDDAERRCAGAPSVMFLTGLMIFAVWTRQRLRVGAPIIVCAWGFFVGVHVVVYSHFTAGRRAFVAVSTLVGATAIIWFAVIHESGLRTAFVRLYLAAVAQQRILGHTDTMLRLGRVALPQYLHPHVSEAVALSDVGAPLRCKAASVCVVSIADRILGCRGTPPAALVAALERIVAGLDEALAFFGVYRAVAYGDYHVVDAGLTTEHTAAHHGLMTDVGRWVARKLHPLGRDSDPTLDVRTAVASGDLGCALVGTHTRRFVMTGSALQAALRALAASTAPFVDASGVATDADAPAHSASHAIVTASPTAPVAGRSSSSHQSSVILPLHDGRSNSSGVHPTNNSNSNAGSRRSSVRSSAVPVTAVQQLTTIKAAMASHFNDLTCTGTFASPPVAAGFRLFCTTDECRFGFFANIACLVLACVGTLASFAAAPVLAAPGAGRTRTAIAITCFVAFVLLLAARAIHLRRRGVLPLVVDGVLLACGGVLSSVAVSVARFANNPQVPLLFFGLFILFMNRRLHWLVAWFIFALQATVVVAVTVLVNDAPVFITLRRLNIVVVPVFWLTWLLFKDSRRRYAATTAAASVSNLAVENIRTQRALLEHLMPTALIDSTVSFLAKAARGEATWHCFESREMLVVEGVVMPDGDAAPAEVPWAFWQAVTAVVEDTCSALAVVQLVGDRFMFAGPFDGSGTRLLKFAVAEFVQLARAIAAHADAHGYKLLAAAHVDLAYTALIGTSSSVFRVLGPAVRQVSAVLAGAPDLPTTAVLAMAAVVAFAEPGLDDADSDAAAVMAASRATALMLRGARDSAAPAGRALGEDDFGPGMLWRVPGGAVRLHPVLLSPPPRRDDTVNPLVGAA